MKKDLNIIKNKYIQRRANRDLLLNGMKYCIACILLVSLVLPQSVFALTNASVIRSINDLRKSEGAVPVRENLHLTAAAKEKLENIIRREGLTQSNLISGTRWSLLANEGYDYIEAGEILGMSVIDSEGILQDWLLQPSHRQDIIHKAFSEIGVAFGEGKRGEEKAFYGVAFLAQPRPKGVSVSLSTSNTKTQIEIIEELIRLLQEYVNLLSA